MNFCWSSSVIVQSIYNRVQKVGTCPPAAASVTLPRERWLQLGSWGELRTPRQQSDERGRPLPSQRSKWKQLQSLVLSATSASHSAIMELPPQCLHTESHTGQGKQILVSFSARKQVRVCFSRHLFSWTSYLTRRKWLLFLPKNIKRVFITKWRVGLECLFLKLCCVFFPFWWGRRFCLPF